MSKCGKCELSLAEVEDILACVDCKLVFHAFCTRNKTLRGSRKATWKCDGCLVESSSTTSRSSDKDSGSDRMGAVLATLEKFQKDMFTQFNVVNVNITSVKEDIKALNDRMDLMKETMETLSAENMARKAECVKLAADNGELKAEVTELKGYIHDMQQYSRRDNVEVFGVPATPKEDVYFILQRLAALLKVPFIREQISIAHRMPLTRRGKHPSIIVRYISRTAKEDWIRAAKECKTLTAAELNDNWESTRIFVRDHLTLENKITLARAKELVRMKKLAYAWCRESRVMVRKTEDSPAVYVRRVSDIEDILKVR